MFQVSSNHMLLRLEELVVKLLVLPLLLCGRKCWTFITYPTKLQEKSLKLACVLVLVFINISICMRVFMFDDVIVGILAVLTDPVFIIYVFYTFLIVLCR